VYNFFYHIQQVRILNILSAFHYVKGQLAIPSAHQPTMTSSTSTIIV